MTKSSLRHTMNHKDLLGLFRSCHRKYSVKKGALKNFANFGGKYLCWNLFLITFQPFRPAPKKRLRHWCFPMKFGKFLRTTTLKNICKKLLLFVSPQTSSFTSIFVTYLGKSYLRNTVEQTGLISFAIINIERSHTNCILQESIDSIIGIFGKIKNNEFFLFYILESWMRSVHILIIMLYCVKKIGLTVSSVS